MEAYPRREKFHAMKVTRLLLKSCAAQSIGRDACLLVAYIASTEDAARYQYAVTYWNQQLDAVLGFDHPRQLWNARKRAVESGWLRYKRDSNRAVGRYWTLIPEHVEKFFASGTDSRSTGGTQTESVQAFEDPNESPNHSANGMNQTANHSANGMNPETNHSTIHSTSGTNEAGNHSTNGKPSYPKEDPVPKEEIPGIVPPVLAGSDSDSGKPPAKTKKPKPAPPGFEQFWKAYPVRKAKEAAAKAYGKAVAKVAAERGVDAAAAAGVILEAAGRYASECRGVEPSYRKHPATWLNGGCWDDEPQQAVGRGGQPSSYQGLEVV